MPAGSEQTWAAQFTYITTTGQQAPWPSFPTSWEYVVRVSATDTGTPLVKLTTTAGADGVIVVTTTSSVSQVSVYLYPAATATLTPQQYSHALWSSPGTTSAVCWLSGSLLVEGAPQP